MNGCFKRKPERENEKCTEERTEPFKGWGCRLCSQAAVLRWSLASRTLLRDQYSWKLEEDAGEEEGELKLQNRCNKAPASHSHLGALEHKGLLQAWGLKMAGLL